MPEQDISELIEFISQIQEDISKIVSNFHELVPEPEELHEQVRNAWEELTPIFDQIMSELDNFRDQADRDRELQLRGLTGAQLQLKLSLYRRRREEFRDELDEFERANKDKKKRRRGFLGGIIQKLFGIINKILDSLGFLPGPDAVKEVKGVIEECLP